MPNKSLYVYGIVKVENIWYWKEVGLNKKKVYAITEGEFSAFVHDDKKELYYSENPEIIKDLILEHNKILDRAMEDFEGVIPLPFNTLIKSDKISAENNLKMWVRNNQERLRGIWSMVKGKKEFGIRIYYEKDKLIQEISEKQKILNKVEKNCQEIGKGINYLFKEKVKAKIKEILQNRINQEKQNFFNELKKRTEDIKISGSRVFIEEEKDLLVSFSVLVDQHQIDEIKNFLEGGKIGNFFFQLAGPFAPYSFAEE